MNLLSIRVITGDVEKLTSFYEQVTGISAIRYTEDFAEIKNPNSDLSDR